MESMKIRLENARNHAGISVERAASELDVAVCMIEKWESGACSPDIEYLPKLAALYRVTTDWLLTGTFPSSRVLQITEHLSNRLFDENKMYTYIGAYCNAKGFYQTKIALSYAREMHKGQFRKERGGEPVPYIYHPLLMTCQALAFGIEEDDLLATTLLHDVCEDCGVDPAELPVNETVQEAVRSLTKPESFRKTHSDREAYYGQIAKNRIASIVKLLDRCHNISGMATCFSEDKMASYIMETEDYLLPILDQCRSRYPEYSNMLFLLKYHMSSVIETIRHYMKLKM